MKFWKHEGIGNDFIIIDGFSNPVKFDKIFAE